MKGSLPSSLEIAQPAVLQPIDEVAANAGLPPDEVEPYGRTRPRSTSRCSSGCAGGPDGKLVCVTAMTPTKAGEGKTTTSVSLTQGLG